MAKRIRRHRDARSATGLDLPIERRRRNRRRCCFENCQQMTAAPKPDWEYQFALCEHHLLMADDDLRRFGGAQKLPLQQERNERRRERERAEQDDLARRAGVPVWKMFASRRHEAPPEVLEEDRRRALEVSPQPNTAGVIASAPVDGIVYYLRSGGYIKIGWTSDLTKRMRAYSPDSLLLATEPGPRALEAKRHRMFAAHRTHGREWYALAPALTRHIDQLKAEHGEPDPVAFAAQPVQVPQPRPKQYVGGNNRGNWQRGESPTGKVF